MHIAHTHPRTHTHTSHNVHSTLNRCAIHTCALHTKCVLHDTILAYHILRAMHHYFTGSATLLYTNDAAAFMQRANN